SDPSAPGNGAHIHFSLLDASGAPLLFDGARPGCLSELAERFAAGILLHADALCALCAPSPCSALRLAPHHWSAGAVCVGQRNREALLRIPPLLSLTGADEAAQMRLEYRAADAAANPYLALGALVCAGLDGLQRELPQAVELRHMLHASPELAHHEHATARALEAELPVACDAIAGTGRLARVGSPRGPAVGVRAELDGLPISERTDAPFRAPTN